MDSVMFSSKSGVWSTPQWLFDQLNQEFRFTLDVCALPENAKCKTFFTPVEDGLKQPWIGNVWCNPPYGRAVGKWVEKAFYSRSRVCTVVMLLPVRTDTRWFHEFILPYAEIRFLQGRLKFGSCSFSAPFPSMVVVFRGDNTGNGAQINQT